MMRSCFLILALLATMLPGIHAVQVPAGCCSGYLPAYDTLVSLASPATVDCNACSQADNLFPDLTTVNAALQITCTTCTVASFGSLPSLTGGSGSVAITCTTCADAVTVGSFPALVDNTLTITMTCTDCPQLFHLGYFPSLQSSSQPISETCTTCGTAPDSTTYASFPELTTLSSTISATCSTCPSAYLLGSFPLLSSSAPQISLSCSTCPILNTEGYFPSLSSTPSSNIASIVLMCPSCTALVYNGVYGTDAPTLYSGSSMVSSDSGFPGTTVTSETVVSSKKDCRVYLSSGVVQTGFIVKSSGDSTYYCCTAVGVQTGGACSRMTCSPTLSTYFDYVVVDATVCFPSQYCYQAGTFNQAAQDTTYAVGPYVTKIDDANDASEAATIAASIRDSYLQAPPGSILTGFSVTATISGVPEDMVCASKGSVITGSCEAPVGCNGQTTNLMPYFTGSGTVCYGNCVVFGPAT